MRNLFDAGVVESVRKTVRKQNEEAKRKDFWTQDAVKGENTLTREQEDRRKVMREEETKAWSYEPPDTRSMLRSDGIYEGRKPLPKKNMEWQTRVDLRPQIVNRPQVGPEAQLNFLSGEQADEMQRQIEERDGVVHRVPGSGIINDRQYWRVLNDWRMAGVDSPHYYIERAALRSYEKNRGINEGSVATAEDVREARAWQLLAEIGDGADLDAGQEQEVDQVLGAGTVKFYRELSQERKDEVLVDGYDRAFVGASTSLGRAYLAQKLGMDTDEAPVMAAELRRQARVGRARREQVKKDMADVWGEMVTATGSGKVFSLDPRDHQGRSPEFLAGAASLVESQRMAAAFIKDMVYGEDGRSPRAQGMQTGIDGLRTYGYSKYEDGRWVVELTKLHQKDERAYELAVSAIAGLVDYQKGNESAFSRMLNSFSGMTVEGLVHGPSRWFESGVMDSLQRAGLAQSGEEKFNDPFWTRRVNKVAQDIQQVRMGQYQARSTNGLVNFLEDASGVFGGALPFMVSYGVLPVLQTMDQEETKYLAKGTEPAKARLAAMGEAAGMWAANIWGLGKGGKLVGKAYDRLMNWAGKKAGYRGLLARALETDRWWGRGPLFVGMEGVLLHSQTVMEPYARYLASNMFTGGDGKSFNEALAEAKEAMTWRNFLVGLPMSVLLGYGRYAQNSPFRASQVAIAEFNRMKLEWADSREAMDGGGFAEADIKAILNAKNDGEKLKLFDLGLERSEMMKVVREGKANVENDIALMIVPDSNEANMLMEMGAIPRFEIVNGKVRVYGADSMDFKEHNEEASAKDSTAAELGKEIKEESGGENAGQERSRKTDYVEFNMDEAGYYLTAKAQEWYSNQDFTLRNAVLGNESVDYFAKRCDVQFEKSGELMTRRYLERMADEALNRVNERRHSKVMWSREEADAQEKDVLLSVLPGSFRNRVEVAMKRNELSRNPQETGKITQREIDARSGDYGVHTPAFNYELECGKKVIRYYEGEATFLDLVEEMAELYVKGEMKAGRELGWFAENLKETQEALKAQDVRNWMLADVDLLDGKSGVKKQEMAVVEGMSKLMQAVHVGEFRKRKLPESVQRFLEIAMALLRKVADMAGLAGAFRKAVDSGAVKGDFASFVYDAVGADFIQTRYDAGKREFQKRLNEIKGKPKRMLEFYDWHVAYAEQYGLENYLYQLEHPGTGKLQSDSKFLNFVGEKMKQEFEAQGREFFEKMKGASLQEMKDVLKAARAWNRRHKYIYKLPGDAGKTASFSVVAMDSSGAVLKPETFITREDGSPDWFTIPKRKGQPAMPVRLLVGEDWGVHRGYGLMHIAASRDLDGMWKNISPERYIRSILANASELYLVGDREILVKGKRPSSWMILQLNKEGRYYSIVTAYPVNNPNKRPQGKRIPLDGRFSSTPGKEATGVWGPEERKSSGGLPSKGGALGKASQEAMTADRESALLLPQGARVVNINDVRLRFDNGDIVPATFSIADAREQGLFRDGHFEAGNAVITEPGVTFSIAALHASPHSFRKFSTDFMGKGEGAQAYGWGLYFAQNPEVNRSYLNQFSQDKATWKFRDLETDHIVNMAHGLRDRIPFPEHFNQLDKAGVLDRVLSVLSDLSDARGDKGKIEAIKEELREDIRINEEYSDQYPQAKKQTEFENIACQYLLEHLDEIEIRPASTSNYKVELNVDDYFDFTKGGELLFWDEGYGSSVTSKIEDWLLDEGKHEASSWFSYKDPANGYWMGGEIYRSLADALGSPREASEFLLRHGVKGVRYADGYTRGKAEDEQTYNYVIFDGNDIKITAFADESTGGEWADYVDPQATFSVREMAPVRSCVEELAAGKEAGILRNTAWGKNIVVPRGRAGKKGYGVDHIQEKRLLHGFTPDEAAFIVVAAMKAAESVKKPAAKGNKAWFDRFGVRAVVADDAEAGNPMITGFVLDTENNDKAVGTAAAQLAEQFYALDELSRVHQVGAAMKRAVARFENIIKENPRDWEQIVSHVVEKLKVKQNAKADGTFMKAPNGAETNLTEDQWLSVRTEAFKRWFGDWEHDSENASKVVDENGEPKVVYHGTLNVNPDYTPFTVFDTKLTGAGERANFFSDTRDVAGAYGHHIYHVFLNIRHPMIIDAGGDSWGNVRNRADGTRFGEMTAAQKRKFAKSLGLTVAELEGNFTPDEVVGLGEGHDTNEWTEIARREGYDGVIFRDIQDNINGFSGIRSTDYATFNSVAIKSATDNRGTYDPQKKNITFSVREDLLGDMKRQMEKTRSEAVREYWRHVTERLEREEQAMRALLLKPKGSDEFLRARVAEARSIMKVAVETLPESVRGKLAGQEQKLERWMKLLERGAFQPGYTLARHDVERLAVDMGIMPEEMPFFIGKRVDELVLKTYRRAAEVIELYVRDGLFAETRKMIAEHEAVIDEKTRKFKVSRLGAAPTEFLRSVIKPAVYATHAVAEKKAAELSERLRLLEMKLNEFKDGRVVSGMDELMKERMKLEGEFNWWMNYSAARSSDVNRMLGIHEAVSEFVSRSAEVWQAHLHEKLEGWKKAGEALMDELPKGVNQKSMHLAEAEMTDLGTDSETGRIKRGVLSSWLDNTVNKLQQLGDGPGGEFFRKFKVEFLNVTNRTQALRAQQVEKMHDVMKKLSGAASERKLNQWLTEWDTKVDLGLTLREKGVKKTKLTIDQAAKLLERREKNPWWGVDMYSQKAIDLLREEYEAWGRGENRARKWFEVEEWYDMDPQPMPKLSRDQALFVLMCMDQPNVFDSRIPDRMTPMRRRGWTDEHKTKLEEFIGPVGMALKSVLFEEYALVGDRIRPLYEDRYGVPFSKRRNYSPLRWMVDETKDDSELAAILGDDGTIAVGRSDGFLSVRDESHQRYLDTTQGALALFWKHHANAVNWVCTQEMVERYKGILSDPSVAQKLKVNIGALDFRGFQALINRLEHGGRDAVAELDAAEVVKNRIMNARAVSVLSGQVTSLLRQTTAVFNALHGCDLSTAEWIHGMSRVISGKSVLSVSELFHSDLFQARKDGFMYSVLLGYKKQLGGRLGLLEQLSEKSMNALGWLDAGCNAVSFAAAFDHYFRQGVEQGMSKPEAMEYARDVIEEGLSKAQPTNWTQTPKMLEKTKGIFSAEWFLMYETLQRGATVFSLWKRGKKKLAMRSWLIQGVAMQALGYLINNVMRPGGDDDEKKDPLNYLPGIVLGPLNGVPFLGRGADWLIEQAADIFDLKVQTRTGIAGSELEFMIKDLMGLFRDLEQVDNWQSVRTKSRGVATLGSITAMLGAWRNPRGGAVTSVSLGMATLANYLKHLAGMAERWFGE